MVVLNNLRLAFMDGFPHLEVLLVLAGTLRHDMVQIGLFRDRLTLNRCEMLHVMLV